ncbi:TPA: recombinase [Klebsiella variicola]|nr:recombinase [Klebsiella variicola]
MNLELLDAPFPHKDIEWRIQQAGKSGSSIWAKVLAYVTNRAIMKRLDEVCGKAGWRNEYRDIPNNGGVECGISIKVDGEWITKWDASENTQVEAVKGGRSSAMKRAAVQWGIGRYLYDLDVGFATISGEKAEGFTYARTKELGAFYWKPPALPVWALPSAASSGDQCQPVKPSITTEEANDILAEFCRDIESENNSEVITQKYSEAWFALDGFSEHQSKCHEVTGIRRREIKQASGSSESAGGSHESNS